MSAAAKIATLVAAAGVLLPAAPADAQYRNFTWGFEAGYFLFAPPETTGVDPHTFNLGFFAGAKLSDNWWYYGRATLGFTGEHVPGFDNTVVLLHIVPASARYYFLTDHLRPWLGITNSFQLLINKTDQDNRDQAELIFWGPGIGAGIEIKLQRDLFLGFEADGFYMINFTGPNGWVGTLNAQIIFFI